MSEPGDDLPRIPATVLKMGGIGALALLMLVPLALTFPVVRERMERRDAAIQSIQEGWGTRQALRGPVLVLPYREAPGDPPQLAFVLPEELVVDGRLTPETRWRGIYQGIVYTAEATVHGRFQPPDLAALGLAPDQVLWDQVYLALSLSDLRGVENTVVLDWGGTKVPLRPGTRAVEWRSGLHAPVLAPTGPTAFRVVLPFRGSAALEVAPVGATTRVSLTSAWPHPSFYGAFLPATREIRDDGFRAEWRASAYGRQVPQQWRAGEGAGLGGLDATSFGVELMAGVDAHRSVDRATKYGILVVVLVFLTFFLFETLAGARIHPFQYALVGLGVALFFVLLLALSEVLPFATAYAAAAGAIVLLLSLYTLSVLGTQRRTLVCTGALSACFSLLYVILRAEDYALLAGSLALFAALAVVMRLTRRIDWYARDAAA